MLRKISKEASNFQRATVVWSLKLPVRRLVFTIQYGNIVTLVTRSLDESLGQSLGKILTKSMGSDPMRYSFLALRDSCRDSGRDWFSIQFFSAWDFLPIPGFEPMPYLFHYLQATTLPTRPPITWKMNASKFFSSMNCKFERTFL